MTAVQYKYNKKIKRIVDLFKIMRPEKIILFGSAASGKIHKNSDIDICVTIDTDDQLKTTRQLRELIWKHKIGFEPEIDIHVYPPYVYEDYFKRDDPFITEVAKGKVLYDKRSLH
jgi:predicted nucleotidyltransferase